jgi:hypothetical protein
LFGGGLKKGISLLMRKIFFKKCLKQIFKPSRITPHNTFIPGEGNCQDCKPHEDNINCISYAPVTVSVVDVADND